MDILALHGLNFVYSIATLGLIVLGLAVVFGLLGVMNMAHGELVMIGAYCAFVVQQAGLHPVLAVPLALCVCGLVGLAMEWTVVRHLYRRPFDTLLATWGIAILLRECVENLFGRGYQSVNETVGGTVMLLSVRYPTYRLILIAIVITLFIGLFVWYQRSSTGARIKAMVSNPELAAAVGINGPRLARSTFVFGTAMAGLAGVLLAPLVRIEPFMGIDYLLSSFFVLVVGGLGSLEGLLIGSTVIGGSNVVASAAFGNTGGYLTVLAISILFLWLKQDGLYARR
ncbi:branched-chain amino acid ABC transporter permease [Mesorhizobium sp. CAU 1732]|uniref:branched-chain amino acid ABC transporter permease n=1 Tax=Mesorhizobium sp. CAU 1732 TaxID=3140358 RepID=UPI003261B3CD